MEMESRVFEARLLLRELETQGVTLTANGVSLAFTDRGRRCARASRICFGSWSGASAPNRPARRRSEFYPARPGGVGFGCFRVVNRALRESRTNPPASLSQRRSSATAATLDLLQSAHLLRSMWGHEENAAYLIAREPVSEFWSRRAPSAYSLRLCCRIPGDAGSDRVIRVSINGSLICEAKVGPAS